MSRSLQFKEDEVARLAANVKERDVAVNVAESRAKELAEARAEAERARGERNAAAAAAAKASADEAAAHAKVADLGESVSALERKVGVPTTLFICVSRLLLCMRSELVLQVNPSGVQIGIHTWSSVLCSCGPYRAL